KCQNNFVQCRDYNLNSPWRTALLFSSVVQSIGDFPWSASQALTVAKWPQPRKGTGGRRADSGDGRLAVKTRWLQWLGSNACLACVWAPHSKKALGVGSWATRPISASVARSQPRFACDAGWPSSAVSAV